MVTRWDKLESWEPQRWEDLRILFSSFTEEQLKKLWADLELDKSRDTKELTVSQVDHENGIITVTNKPEPAKEKRGFIPWVKRKSRLTR